MTGENRVLHRERVFEGVLVKVDRERVLLPGGREATLETIRHPGAAAILPFTSEDTVLLIRQFRHAAGGFILEAPAGKLDHGEPPETCARRELEEEVGWRAGRLTPLGAIVTTPGFTDEVIWLYEAHDLRLGRQSLEPDEVLEVLEVPLVRAVEMALAGEIRDAKTVCAVLLAWARRSTMPPGGAAAR